MCEMAFGNQFIAPMYMMIIVLIPYNNVVTSSSDGGGEFTHVDISFCISNFSTYLVSGSGLLGRHIVQAL